MINNINRHQEHQTILCMVYPKRKHSTL